MLPAVIMSQLMNVSHHFHRKQQPSVVKDISRSIRLKHNVTNGSFMDNCYEGNLINFNDFKLFVETTDDNIWYQVDTNNNAQNGLLFLSLLSRFSLAAHFHLFLFVYWNGFVFLFCFYIKNSFGGWIAMTTRV